MNGILILHQELNKSIVFWLLATFSIFLYIVSLLRMWCGPGLRWWQWWYNTQKVTGHQFMWCTFISVFLFFLTLLTTRLRSLHFNQNICVWLPSYLIGWSVTSYGWQFRVTNSDTLVVWSADWPDTRSVWVWTLLEAWQVPSFSVQIQDKNLLPSVLPQLQNEYLMALLGTWTCDTVESYPGVAWFSPPVIHWCQLFVSLFVSVPQWKLFRFPHCWMSR